MSTSNGEKEDGAGGRQKGRYEKGVREAEREATRANRKAKAVRGKGKKDRRKIDNGRQHATMLREKT